MAKEITMWLVGSKSYFDLRFDNPNQHPQRESIRILEFDFEANKCPSDGTFKVPMSPDEASKYEMGNPYRIVILGVNEAYTAANLTSVYQEE